MGRNVVIVGLVLGALLGSLNTNGARSTVGEADHAARSAELRFAAASCGVDTVSLHDPISCVFGEH
jgi:hypothetical protein